MRAAGRLARRWLSPASGRPPAHCSRSAPPPPLQTQTQTQTLTPPGPAAAAAWREGRHCSQPPSAGIRRRRGAAAAAAAGAGGASCGAGPRPPPAAEITSASNPYVKHCVRLRDNGRYRQQMGRALLVGSTVLGELAAEVTGLRVEALFFLPGPGGTAPQAPPGVEARRRFAVSRDVMRKLAGVEQPAGVDVVAEVWLPPRADLSTPEGWAAAAAAAEEEEEAAAGSGGGAAATPRRRQLRRLLALEGVQDPGNLGTLLRSAAAFGWDAVWLLPGCCDPFNDKALRASRGAALRCPIGGGGLDELVGAASAHGLLLLAAEPEPQGGAAGSKEQQQQQQRRRQRQQQAAGPRGRGVCLVLGTEGAGLSDAVLAVAAPVAVPMAGRMESLNVGVAGSILMFVLGQPAGLPPLLERLRQLGQAPEA